jgi:hypothetical protein
MYTPHMFIGYGPSGDAAWRAADDLADAWQAAQGDRLLAPPARYGIQAPPTETDPRWVHVTVVMAQVQPPTAG